MTADNIRLTPQLVQSVRDAVDILEIASEHTRMRKAGHRHTGLCPLHREKTPSFSVDPDRGLFYCFGCGRGGDAIKLHMLLTGDDFPVAIEVLARRYGIPVPRPTRRGRRDDRQQRDLEGVLEAAAAFFSRQLDRSSSVRAYLERRRVPDEIVEKFGLGYAPEGWRNLLEELNPKFPLVDLEAAGLVARSESGSGNPYDRFRHRLMFPIRTAAGRLVGFGGRTLGDDTAKYINTSETEQFQKGYLLYGLDVAKREIRESRVALLVEGYFDVLGAVAAGVIGTVASMGTALTPEQARLLARYVDEVIVGYDGDAAGEQASRRALPLLLAQGLTVRRARFGSDQDPDSLRVAEGPEAVVSAVEGAADGVELELASRIPSQAQSQPRIQARAAREVSDLLRAIPDSVLRYNYCRQAAARLGVPAELLWRRLGRGVADRGERIDQAEPGRREVRSLEERVLQLLLSGVGELPPPSELPPPEAFLIAACRNIYRAFCDLYKSSEGVRPTAQQVIAGVPEDGGEVDQVARLLLEGSADSAAMELEQSLHQVNRRWIQQQLRALASQISDAQRAADAASLERLVREKTALSRRLHRGSTDSGSE